MVAYLHHTNVGYKLCGRWWLAIIGPIYDVKEAILHLFWLHKSLIGMMQDFRHLPLSDIAAIYPSSAAIRPTVYGLLGSSDRMPLVYIPSRKWVTKHIFICTVKFKTEIKTSLLICHPTLVEWEPSYINSYYCHIPI